MSLDWVELGVTDEGVPGPRGDSGFYAAYFRDLDGNKLNAFCMSSPAEHRSKSQRAKVVGIFLGTLRG